MTEEKWLTCQDPVRLLAHLARPACDRKLLLYAVACCRAHWHLPTHASSREAVDWAERFADGAVPRDEESDLLVWQSEGAAFHCEALAERDDIAEWAEGRDSDLTRLSGRITRDRSAAVAAAYLANQLMASDTTGPTLSRYERLLLVQPLRDIFGNPFRPVTFSLSWRTDTAVALARQMYESREFGAMPILADALQDAGCTEPAILDHCRASGEHVRGCWVVDLVLGKE